MDEEAPVILNYAPGQPRSLCTKLLWATGIGVAIAAGGVIYRATMAQKAVVMGEMVSPAVQWQNGTTNTNPSADNLETTP